jgi:hypothetical protein
VEVQLHYFLTSALDGVSDKLYARSFYLQERMPVPLKRGLGDPQRHYNGSGEQKLTPAGIRTSNHLARKKMLHCEVYTRMI